MKGLFVGLIVIFVARFWLNWNPTVLDSPSIDSVKDQFPSKILKWYERGSYETINGRKIFYIYEKCTNPHLKDPPTYLVVHGFPSSTFEYHKVLDKLRKYGNVFLHDHLGFGFSDGPGGDFTYSLSEASDNALAIWRYVGIKKAHIISHDMGDSIVAETLARYQRDLLPDYFKDFFQSVTFTNGGMKIRLANLRITQHICKNSERLCISLIQLGSKLSVSRAVLTKQLKSIWSPIADVEAMEEDIANLVSLNEITRKNFMMAKTFYYLWDRYHFEDRFYDSFSSIDMKIPLRFIWGDADAVAPLAIPQSFKDILPNLRLKVVEGGGHFWMLEMPDTWVEEVTKKFT